MRVCGRPCDDAWRNRQKQRGVQLLNLYAEIRKNRKTKKNSAGRYSLGDVNRLMAEWFAQDRTAGRETHHPELVRPVARVFVENASKPLK